MSDLEQEPKIDDENDKQDIQTPCTSKSVSCPGVSEKTVDKFKSKRENNSKFETVLNLYIMYREKLNPLKKMLHTLILQGREMSEEILDLESEIDEENDTRNIDMVKAFFVDITCSTFAEFKTKFLNISTCTSTTSLDNSYDDKIKHIKSVLHLRLTQLRTILNEVYDQKLETDKDDQDKEQQIKVLMDNKRSTTMYSCSRVSKNTFETHVSNYEIVLKLNCFCTEKLLMLLGVLQSRLVECRYFMNEVLELKSEISKSNIKDLQKLNTSFIDDEPFTAASASSSSGPEAPNDSFIIQQEETSKHETVLKLNKMCDDKLGMLEKYIGDRIVECELTMNHIFDE